MSELDAHLSFALELAAAAAPRILAHYRRCGASLKADGSEVTVADREAETLMRDMIRRRHPDHSILGEEFGEETGSSAYTWVLDPIDGTASFTLGVPLFATLVALLEDRRPVAGVVCLPAIAETLWAARGAGCWFRAADATPERARVAPSVPLAEASASSAAASRSDIGFQPGQPRYRVSELVRRARKFRFVPDSVQHALVARGRLHVAVDPVMQPWDIAAIVPCVEEAGGVAATIAGVRDGVTFGGSLVTCAGGSLLEEVVELLRP
jgi:histidinol-phosphatase